MGCLDQNFLNIYDVTLFLLRAVYEIVYIIFNYLCVFIDNFNDQHFSCDLPSRKIALKWLHGSRNDRRDVEKEKLAKKR